MMMMMMGVAWSLNSSPARRPRGYVSQTSQQFSPRPHRGATDTGSTPTARKHHDLQLLGRASPVISAPLPTSDDRRRQQQFTVRLKLACDLCTDSRTPCRCGSLV